MTTLFWYDTNQTSIQRRVEMGRGGEGWGGEGTGGEEGHVVM